MNPTNLEILKTVLEGSEHVIEEVPIRCQKNAIFIVNVAALDNEKDILADDNGSYRNDGTSYTLLTTSDDFENDDDIASEALKRNKIMLDMGLQSNQFIVTKTFYGNLSCKDFTRKIYDVRNKDGIFPYKILQYGFKGPEEDFKILFHKNSKKSFRPYARKSESTRLKMVDAVSGNSTGPSIIYDRLFEEAGGISNNKSSASLPTIRSIKYQRSLQRENLSASADPVAEFVKYGLHEKSFVRNFQILPSLCAILAADNQINDIVNFCTDPAEFTILTIDTTYNVCEGLYVTPLTYKHLRLIDKQNETNPVLPGPALVHSSLGVETFKFFGESLVRLNPKLKEILAVGSDRDKSIDNGFMASFPIARILSCKRHVQGNITKTLSELGISSKSQQQYLEEIFGNDRTQVKVFISFHCFKYTLNLVKVFFSSTYFLLFTFIFILSSKCNPTTEILCTNLNIYISLWFL